MRKIYSLVLLFTAGALTTAGAADLQDQPQAQDLKAAEDLVKIRKTPDKSGLSLSVAGFEFELSSRETSGEAKGKQPGDSGKYRKRRRSYQSRVASIELGFSQMRGADYSAYPPGTPEFMDMNLGRSIQLGLNLFKAGYGFDREGHVGISSALGIYWNNYVFTDKTVCIGEENGRIEPYTVSGDPKKSKMRNLGLRVPLTLDANLGELFLSLGGFGELDVRSYTKTTSPKKYADLNYTDPLQYGLIGRIGYHGIYVYGNYFLSNMFKSGKGPEGTILTIGLGIGL